MTDKQIEPVKSTKFQPGQSGNPGGRKKGSKNKTTLVKKAIEGELVESLKADMQDILDKAVSMAKAGDGPMITLLINKFLPNARAEDEDKGGKGFGGISIIVNSTEAPIIETQPAIDAESEEIEDDEQSE